MELGFQEKKKTYTLAVCVVLLLFAGLYLKNNWPTSDEGTAPAAPAIAQNAPAPTRGPQTATDYERRRRQQAINIYNVDPTIHVDWLEHNEVVDYTATKRNLFRYEAPPPPPPPKLTSDQIKKRDYELAHQPPPPPPPPPPIDLKYYGFATDSATKVKRVFLTNGNDIFIAAEGDIVANRYRIIRIGVNSVEVEDMKNRNRQSLPLIEG
ncbi:MAG: hypothetical protein PHX83_00340 [Acidobacteriia bacterium]|nr:hypothetical protein [Terriglobia bacterium]